MIPNLKIPALLGLAMVVISCAPKAEVVPEKKPEEKKKEVKVPEPVVQEPEMPALPSDEAPRLPEAIMDLPPDSAFRPSNPVLPKTGAGGLSIRPPTEPPSRVKPKDPAPAPEQ